MAEDVLYVWRDDTVVSYRMEALLPACLRVKEDFVHQVRTAVLEGTRCWAASNPDPRACASICTRGEQREVIAIQATRNKQAEV